LSIEKKILVHR